MADIVDPTADLFTTAAPDPVAARAAELERMIAESSARPVVQEIIEDDLEPELELPVASRPAASSPSARARPKAESELTEAELRVRQLEDQLARSQARALESDTAAVYTPLTEGNELIEFYVLSDGWTAWGQVWYRGQEIAVEVGSTQYQDTFDRNGNSFLALLDDEAAQFVRYGDVKIRRGRWPGKLYTDPRALAKEAARGRSAPLLRV